MGELTGQVALVTGGGRGLGAAIALGLAEAGADVAIMAFDTCEMTAVVDLVRAQGRRAFGATAAVSDWLAVQAAIGEIEEQLGPVSILVNAAMTYAPHALVEDAHPQEWARAIAINLTAPFFCAHAVLPGMVAAQWGRIITLSSQHAHTSMPTLSAYSAAKAGLDHFMRVLAAEVSATQIVALAVDPERAPLADSPPPTPEQCAALICRLCGPAGEAWHGQVVAVMDVPATAT